MSPPQPRDPLVEFFWSALQVARKLEAIELRDPRIARLTPVERLVVQHIGRHPGTSLGDLAAQVNLQTSNASAAVRRLVDLGLVARSRDTADARRVVLVPTAAAEKNLELVHDEWARATQGATVDPDDVAAALRVVTALDTWLSEE